MAVLTRRVWTDLRTEVLKRIGREGDTAAQARVERLLEAAHYDLGILFHHPELDDENTSVTCSTSSNKVALPSGTYAVISVSLRAVSGGVFVSTLTQDSSWYSLKSYAGRAQRPKTWMRLGNSLYFDSIPDQAYPLTIWRYKEPTAPDFSPGISPSLGRAWDEHLVEHAVSRAGGAYWSPDLMSLGATPLQEFLERVAQPSLKESPVYRLGPHPTRAATHGGAQG